MTHAADMVLLTRKIPVTQALILVGWRITKQLPIKKYTVFLQSKDPRFDEKRWNMIKNNPDLMAAAKTSYEYSVMPKAYKAQPMNCQDHIFWTESILLLLSIILLG